MSRRDGRDPNNPVAFKAPYVDPSVADPAAAAYANRMARRVSPPPTYDAPVTGSPNVAVPRLDGEPVKGMTMAQQAVGGIVQPASTPVHPSASMGLTPSDMLPEAARNDPAFQHGHGSMFAVNQPAMAAKYGVVRGGRHVHLAAPSQPPPAQKPAPTKLSQSTVEGIEAVARFQEQAAKAESSVEDRAAVVEAQEGPAGGVGATKEPMTEQQKRELLSDMDEFDMSRAKNSLLKDLLNNEEQRKIIEARLKPLDIMDIFTSGRIRQVVPVNPGVFEPEYQSYIGHEDLTLKRLIGEESSTLKPTDRYLLDKYAIMGLTVALHAVNKRPLPSYQDSSNKFDEAAFWKKYGIVANFDYHMLASMLVNWFWFDIRVRRLYKADVLGNG